MSLENKLGMYLILSVVLILSGVLFMIVLIDFEWEPVLYLLSRIVGFFMILIGFKIIKKHFTNY